MHLRLRSDALSWRTIDDEVIAVDFHDARYLSANPAGGVLWELLADGSTLEALADALVSRFRISSEDARADVAIFVGQLEARALLESVAV
jgi:coenzyme PQQ synthesis protein D (PqqD)